MKKSKWRWGYGGEKGPKNIKYVTALLLQTDKQTNQQPVKFKAQRILCFLWYLFAFVSNPQSSSPSFFPPSDALISH